MQQLLIAAASPYFQSNNRIPGGHPWKTSTAANYQDAITNEVANSKRGGGYWCARWIERLVVYLWPVVRVKAVGTLEVGGVVGTLRQLAARARRPQVEVAGPARQLLWPRGRRHGRRAGAARREVAEVGHASGLLEGLRPAVTPARGLQLLRVVRPLLLRGRGRRQRRLVERRSPVGRVRLVRPNLTYTHKPDRAQRRRMRTTSTYGDA